MLLEIKYYKKFNCIGIAQAQVCPSSSFYNRELWFSIIYTFFSKTVVLLSGPQKVKYKVSRTNDVEVFQYWKINARIYQGDAYICVWGMDEYGYSLYFLFTVLVFSLVWRSIVFLFLKTHTIILINSNRLANIRSIWDYMHSITILYV